MSNRKCKKLSSKIPNWCLELGNGGISRTITSWATLIPSCITPSGPWLKADALVDRIDWGQAFQCWTSSCWYWESCLKQLQMIYTKIFKLPRVFQRKALNSTQSKGTLAIWFFQCLNWCQQKLILSQKNKFANEIWLEQVAPAVYLEMIFTFLVGLRVWDDWFEPEGKNLCKTLLLSEVLLWYTWWKLW